MPSKTSRSTVRENLTSIEPLADEKPLGTLRVQVVGCKELAAADTDGKSDPFVIVVFARQRHKTHVRQKTLSPTYDAKLATFDFPVYESVLEKVGSLLEFVVWDKDMVGRDYLGELHLPASEWFKHSGKSKVFESKENHDFWLPLVSSQTTGRSRREAKGDINLKIGFVADTSADAERAYSLIIHGAKSPDDVLTRPPTEGVGTVGGGDDVTTVEKPALPTAFPAPRPSRNHLTSFRLNWAGTKIDYSFHGHGDVAGAVLLEIQGAANLPKAAGGAVGPPGSSSFDMDPFVLITFGHKEFRTRVIRHSLDPTWNEKFVLHVRESDLNAEGGAKVALTVLDWDSFNSKDFVGEVVLPVADLIARAPEIQPTTGLYPVDTDVSHGMTRLVLPLSVGKDITIDDNARPTLSVRAKYESHASLRQQFWRQNLQNFDANRNGFFVYSEIMSFLNKVNLALTADTVYGFWAQHKKDPLKEELTLDEAIVSLETSIGTPLEKGQQPNWAVDERAAPLA